MTRRVLLVALFPLAIACCGQPGPTSNRSGAEAATGTTISTGGKSGHGTGVVKAIDHASGKVTLEHGPIAELRWPAMTMGFLGTSTMLNELSVGDKVDFAFGWDGQSAQLTSVSKR